MTTESQEMHDWTDSLHALAVRDLKEAAEARVREATELVRCRSRFERLWTRLVGGSE